jgi:hypothetical protein
MSTLADDLDPITRLTRDLRAATSAPGASGGENRV